MPPRGVLMSTCLSCPSGSFFTLMLQAKSVSSRAPKVRTHKFGTMRLIRAMERLSFRDLRRAFDAGAAYGHVRNTHGEMAMNWDFPKQRPDRSHFRNRRIGKCAHVIFDLGKIGRKIRIAHRYHDRSLSGMVEHLLQQGATYIRHRDRIADFSGGRNYVNGSDHPLCLIHRLEYLV